MAAANEERMRAPSTLPTAGESAGGDALDPQRALERKTQELAHSLALMRATLESTTDGILVTDATGRITHSNEKFARLWQIPADLRETTHQKLQELIGRQVKERAGYDQALDDIYRSWPAETFDLLELNDGRSVERYSKIQMVDGQPVGRVWSYRDVTDRQRTAEVLQQQRERFEVTLASIGDAVITTDTEARVTYLNPVAETMTGWKMGEAAGQPLEKVFHIVNESTRAPAPNPVVKVLQEGRVVGLANHTALIAKDGRSTAIEDSAAPIRDVAGKICGAVMVFHDVTARRRAEELLRESEARLRATFSQAAVGMATATLEGRFEQVNERFAAILGYPAEELRRLTFRQITLTEDLPQTDAAIRRLLAGEIPDYAMEKRYRRKDGGLVWSLTTVTLVKDENGKPQRFIGVIEDITQRRHAEDALQARERELSLIYHHVSDIIFYLVAGTGGELRFVSANRAFFAATGLSEATIAGKLFSDVVPEPSRTNVLRQYDLAVRKKETVRWEETTETPAGRRVGLVSITPVFDSEGKYTNVVGTVHDVTERRHLEDFRLRLAAVVESSTDAVITKSLEGIIITWNHSAERIFGYTAAEAVGKPVTILVPPDRENEEPEILARLRRGERIEHYETVRRRKDGTLLNISLTVSPIRDANGHIVGASKIARDITAQKKTEETLRKSEARFRLIGEVVPQMLWTADAKGEVDYFNERWDAYIGRDTQANKATRESAIHPDDRPRTLEAWAASLRSGEPFEIEYRLRRFDGEHRWFVARAVPFRDDAGQIVRWYGSSTDIHEQKVTAEALREQYLVTEQLNDVARALATELDPAKIVQIITDAGTRITRAQFGAFFHSHMDDQGESYTLYTLSGAPRAAFEKFPMPRATEVFGPTFRGEGVIRLADVRKDPRFGKNAPFHGMPMGHLPVVSYLAVPVIARSGDVLGGLFFGHAAEGVFTERDEKIVVGVAAQAAAALDNAKLYQAEQQARAAAERANKAKDDFLATLSHELRNPLNPVLLIASEAALNPDLPEEIRADFEMIQRNVELEARLIDDLLDLTRITRRKMSLELRPVDVHEALHEAMAIVRRDAENKRIAVTSSFVGGKVPIMGDPARLQQIFWNVLRNAVKFTPDGGKVTVQTRKLAQQSLVEVEITDTGIGMTAAEIARIFEAFAQGDHASSTGAHRFGGLGLGLAIAQYLVQMHGGRLEAQSAGSHQGSTFRIALPLLDRSGGPGSSQPVT
jgi:PAS domain S-box-containing protein